MPGQSQRAPGLILGMADEGLFQDGRPRGSSESNRGDARTEPISWCKVRDCSGRGGHSMPEASEEGAVQEGVREKGKKKSFWAASANQRRDDEAPGRRNSL